MLLNLEMPFFVGIVDRDGLKVTIFSGHYLTPLLCYKDPITIERLSAKLCEATSITGLHDDYFEETSPGFFTLYFPKVAEVSAQTNDHDLKEAVKKVQGSCSLMLENIAARISNEYTFKTHDAQSLLFFSGPTSLRFFQDNFFDRLTEGFFNIHNAYSLEQNRSQAANLFDLYEKIYLDLTSYYGEDNLPAPLKRTYQGAKNRIKEQDEGSRIA